MIKSLHPSLLWQRLFLFSCFIGATVHGSVVAFGRPGRFRDFDFHRDFGAHFLSGEYLYSNAYLYPYMPSAAMFFAPLALLDRDLGIFLRYSVAVCALLISLVFLQRMVESRHSKKINGLIPGILTVVLTLQFILYDLDDGGPQLILTGMLVAGIYFVWKGSEKGGALWFGLAIALKVSPALFVPFFIWKRLWRLAGYTILAAMFWVALPIVWMGSSNWWAHQKVWFETAAGSAVGITTWHTLDNVQRVRNQALRPALMRYLVTYPENHPIRKDDPAYWPLLDLPTGVADTIGIVATVALLSIFCWYTRHPYRTPQDSNWVKECSGVMIITLLISPMAWIQHLPWILPGLYVIIATIFVKKCIGRPTFAALGGYLLLTVILNYEFIGKQNFQVLLSYHPFTIAMLLVLGILLFSRNLAYVSGETGASHSPQRLGT
ncbi:MAG: DUF2029 domain-containing protein [Nitrospinae bacterium]|nr:DUF2029 domain-containing protein [Nitrospinota bacterium]